ncbi:TetR/AcrR family transcriptional regulator [Specibacter sp. NPDC057265]|uniref:TetR/AcrR family transcriptional regulator n=1 Tax=Specibacter sp. NPDC057265 TaxID=3346075 RepID=UPI003631AE6B
MAGRPRSFDRETALLIAMEKFWRSGYEATTIAKLTEAMEITPPSLYAAFGDKDQLFAAASTVYFDAISVQFEKALALPTLREAVTEMLVLTAAAHTDGGTPPGCFLATEPRLASERTVLRNRLARRVEQAVQDGDVPAHTDPEQVAGYVMAAHAGMSSRARDGGTLAELMAIATMTLNALP